MSEGWLERLTTEKDELKLRRDALTNFLESSECADLDEEAVNLLLDQEVIMKIYYDILVERIKLEKERNGG